MQTAYITHPDCLRHVMIEHHPECPERLRAVEDQISARGLMDFLRYYEAPNADVHQIERAHKVEYVESIFNNSPLEGFYHVDPDTWMNPYTLEAALRAAGAGILAVDLLASGEMKRAFCNVRPPGHHAEHATGLGFCFFNNIAIAALHAVEHHKLERVAIVDFDVHHGNGTEDILAHNKHTLFCSTYQHPFFPGYAGKSMERLVVNVPLPAGTAGPEFRFAVQKHWLPALREFKPQMLFISAGFDAHFEDDMSGFSLSDDDYVWVTRKICGVADEYAEGRVVSMLEGGYDLTSLGRCAAAHVKVLMNL
ncbi:histone deacetylase family protein [Granulosicoccaceae sp. 1_MG-2023]|nr:histone deacetylase family protein [Granulosicoccaceae sp. 1_MG-2023]